MRKESLNIVNVSKSFGSKVVLENLSFKAEPGEFIVLVGPSGCGKSTMLRAIAGLEPIDSGKIEIGDTDVTSLVPKDRDIAMVFQDYALYPHKNVFENIAFGLRIRRLPEKEIQERVHKAAEKLNLLSLLERKPAALSGGQRQRVAIGRAIVRNPKIFLFDEPLSNLDAKLRGSMRITIAKLHKELEVTVVYVTHDQIEAMTLADKIIVLHNGIVQQMGTPLELYNAPKNVFVATFIGSPPMNLIEGRLELKNNELLCFKSKNELEFVLPNNFLNLSKHKTNYPLDVLWGIRPENLELIDYSNNSTISGQVIVSEILGPTTSVLCDIKGHELQITVPTIKKPARGDLIHLKFVGTNPYMFDLQTGFSII